MRDLLVELSLKTNQALVQSMSFPQSGEALRHRSSTTFFHIFFPELWTVNPNCNTVLTKTPMILLIE
jgi:hypothetical protein